MVLSSWLYQFVWYNKHDDKDEDVEDVGDEDADDERVWINIYRDRWAKFYVTVKCSSSVVS